MLRQSNIEKWVALYVRLSRDDENEGDSNSISHQIEILINYCKQWLVDEEAAEVVYDIGLYIKEGYGPLQIAKKLEARQIPTPAEHFASKGIGSNAKLPAVSCRWSESTITGIMDHWLEYSGHTVNFRTQKLSYKSKKTIYNSPDKWVIFKNTHEAIWTEDIVEAVQTARGNRRRITKMGEMGLFSGLAFCADCGAKHYHCRTTSWTREQECYSCATYRSRKGCSAHYIRAVVLEELVLQNIQRVLAYVQDDEAEFVKLVQRNESYASSVNVDKAKKALQKNEVRIAELDTIIKRLYEDNILGKLSDERLKKLSAEYEREQTSLEKEVLELRETISASESRVVDVERFLKTVRKYTAPPELTPMLVRELVDKIIVHAPDKSSGHRVQRIDIHYKFIGETELSPEYSKYTKKATA